MRMDTDEHGVDESTAVSACGSDQVTVETTKTRREGRKVRPQMSPTPDDMPSELRSFCDHVANGLRKLADPRECIDYVGAELPALLLNHDLFIRMLRDMLSGSRFPDVRHPTIFNNELLLHLDRSGLFSLRLYLWGPGEFSGIHDHNSWGVFGPVGEGLDVVNYRREDDGAREDFAELSVTERLRLGSGETAFTMPLNEGIHKTGNGGNETLLSLNLYGRPLRRGYVNIFDETTGRVTRLLPPRRKKEILAAEALKKLSSGL